MISCEFTFIKSLPSCHLFHFLWHRISTIVQFIAAADREKPVTVSRVSGYIEPTEQPVTFGLHYTATGARESESTKARLSLKYKDAIAHSAYRDFFF